MNVTPIKTPLVRLGDNIQTIITKNIVQLPEQSVVVIASKIFGRCERRTIPKTTDTPQEKHAFARQEADYYIDPHSSKYNLMLTIKRNWMFVNAGIDESNAGNQYSLWPKDLQKSVDDMWNFLRRQYRVRHVGVIMADSTSIPLNWGVMGHGIAHCGFVVLKNYIGTQDLFGQVMQMTQANMMQGITAAAVLTMGEGAEQTPIAMVTEIPDLVFQDRVPTKQELDALHIELEDDAYAPILTAAPWKKGGGGI